VTELSLPEVDGPGLYQWLARENPELAQNTVFVTADTSRERYRSFLEQLDNRVLSKPVSASLLMETLDELVPPISQGDASPSSGGPTSGRAPRPG